MRRDRSSEDEGPGSARARSELSEEQRRRLVPPSALHAEINRIADQLGAAVSGDFDFVVESDSMDLTVQKLVVMTNFLLDTIRRTLADLERRSRTLEAQISTIHSQQLTIDALSAPVLRVWEGVLVLPLVGALAPERMAAATERILERIASDRARVVILDVTGVPEIDGPAAAALVRVAGAASLLGARCALTGVRAAVARALAEEGLDVGAAVLLRDLHEALRWSLAEEARAQAQRRRRL